MSRKKREKMCHLSKKQNKQKKVIGFTECRGLRSMLKCLVGQVVLHGERNGQRINLLCGHDSPQGHTAQVLEARSTAWGSPEMHTAITRPEKTNAFRCILLAFETLYCFSKLQKPNMIRLGLVVFVLDCCHAESMSI